MSFETSSVGARPDPTPAWTTITDAPLAGIDLARETGRLLAWDESHRLYLIDTSGNRLTDRRAPSPILDAAISDTASLVVVLLQGNRLLLLDEELGPVADRAVPGPAAQIAVDPHGRYILVATKTNKAHFFTQYGKPAGQFEAPQPLAHAQFVAGLPRLIAGSAFGMIFAFALQSSGGQAVLHAEEEWRNQIMSSVGRLEVTGDGGMILASCFTHGVQRFDSRGRNEGAYHLGGTTSHAVPDFAGRVMAIATTEGELYVLNRSGNVRWKTGLPRGPVGLKCDGLGRSLYYGMPSGEITRLDLEPTVSGSAGRPAAAGRDVSRRADSVSSGARGGAPLRKPAWSAPVANSDEQAETAVLAVLDEPGRIAVLTNSGRLTLFTTAGGTLGQAPPIGGVGRILRTAPGWIAGATDRQIVLYDARRNQAERLDLSLVELTHLVLRPATYGLATVQERDRIGRLSARGRWVWKRELRVGVEEIAIGPENTTAVTTDDGRLTIYDAAGEPVGEFQTDPPEPLLLVSASAPAGETPPVDWITLARRAQVLRGHARDGVVRWASPVPWESWRLIEAGSCVVAETPDGRALAFDPTGHAREQARNPSPSGPITQTTDDSIERVIKQGEHLIGTELDGRIRWRAIVSDPIGPLAVGSSGTAALLGRSLAWFPSGKGEQPRSPMDD